MRYLPTRHGRAPSVRTSPRFLRPTLAATGTIALVAALAGCGELTVLNPGSTASCVEGEPVSLTTSQDSSGEALTIRYQGPAELAVMFSYGYSVEDIPEADPTGAYAYSQTRGSGDPDIETGTPDQGEAFLLRLDPSSDAGWSASEVDGVLDATFAGDIDDLLDGRDARLALGEDTVVAEISPVFVAVSCDTELESGFVDTLDSFSPELAPEFLLAAPLNPGTAQIGPFVVTSQETVDGVTTGTLRFADNAAEIFDGFVPVDLAESSLTVDVDDVPNDTFSQLWFQEVLREALDIGQFEITSPLTLTGEMDFILTSDSAPDVLPAGEHHLRLVFGNTDLVLGDSPLQPDSATFDASSARDLDGMEFAPAAAGDAKVVFFTVEYDETTGVTFGALGPVPADTDTDTDTDTDGGDSELVATGPGALIAPLAVGALLVLGGASVLAARRTTGRTP